MADSTSYTATVEVPSGGEQHAQPDVINISGSMLVLTWVTFAITAVILYKTAWKPILSGLDKREETLRQAQENAEKIRTELEGIEQVRARTIAEADKRSREILDQARLAAVEAANTIEAKAREEAQIMLDTARREIHTEQDKAMSTLRRESAILAVDISRKILKENLDEALSRKVADLVISKF